MSDARRLLEEVLNRPDDPLVRLVWADWLEEQGGPANVGRAELVRLQVDWQRARWRTRKRGLERRSWAVLRRHPGLIGPLKRVAPDKIPLLATGLGLVAFLGAELADDEEDALQPGSCWRGTLAQLVYRHPTVFRVIRREGSTFGAEMEQDFTEQVGEPACGKFRAEGVALCGRFVAFVTGRISGNVLVPGLYLATLTGGRLGGTWNVPGPRQTGTFELREEG